MATPKQAHAMTTYFVQQYQGRYGVKPNVNRHSARWSFDSLLMDLTVEEAKSLIDFYFETNSVRNHDLDWFFYHYHELVESMKSRDEDKARLERIRKETEARVKEWRKKIGNN